MLKFIPYYGDFMGLHVDQNYFVFRWNNDDCKILVSMAKIGDAVNVHFASDKKGLRKIREAAVDLFEFVPFLFDWCKMIIAVVKPVSVCRLVASLGFWLVGCNGTYKVYGVKVNERRSNSTI